MSKDIDIYELLDGIRWHTYHNFNPAPIIIDPSEGMIPEDPIDYSYLTRQSELQMRDPDPNDLKT